MTNARTRSLVPLHEFESAEASLRVARLEGLARRLRESLRGATPAPLGWQPAPATNTIGPLTHVPRAGGRRPGVPSASVG